MKYIDHFRLNMEREDRLREQRFLTSIGPIGRLFDNHLYFGLTILMLMLISFNIGFLIGVFL